MDKLIQTLSETDQVNNILNNKSFNANSIESVGLCVVSAFLKENKNIAVVVPSLYQGQTLIDFISNFIDPDLILYYPQNNYKH